MFNKDDKFKYTVLYYYFMLQKTDDDISDDFILFYEYDDGELSISLGDLKLKAQEEVELARRDSN